MGGRHDQTQVRELAVPGPSRPPAAGEEDPRASAEALVARARDLDRQGRHVDADRARLAAADALLAAAGDGATGHDEAALRGAADALRAALLAGGRAVALTWCERCGGVIEADWRKSRCAHKHHVDEVRVVVADDAHAVRAELARR